MPDNILKKPYRCQTAVLLAAILAVFRTHLSALVGFIALHFSVIERYRSAPDLVLNRVVRTSQMLGDAVDRPAVFQPNFYFVPLFAYKVLTFPVFCGIMGVVHSGDPFELVCGYSILPQNRYYGYPSFDF